MKRKMAAMFAGTMLVITSYSVVATNLQTQNVADGSLSDSTLIAAARGRR